MLNQIKPLNHYALENPASVYDEEALTALELAARVSGKLTEVILGFNELAGITVDAIEYMKGEITKATEDVIMDLLRNSNIMIGLAYDANKEELTLSASAM